MKCKKLQVATVLLTSLFIAAPIAAYDRASAEAYAKMFAPVKGAKAGKHLHLIKSEQFVNDVRAGKEFVTIDIRTPEETQFFTGNLPGNLVIPFSELFQRHQLAKLPRAKPIVILCHTGVRATAAATALRDVGFEDTYVLKGGFKALAAYLGPKQAYQPLKAKAQAEPARPTDKPAPGARSYPWQSHRRLAPPWAPGWHEGY